MDENKFKEIVEKHRQIIASMVETKGCVTLGMQRTGEDLALAWAQCKCERCGAEERLQIHHMVAIKSLGTKEYTSSPYYWKLMSQRLYWANLLVLCEDCHREVEGFTKDKPEFMGSISEKRIRYVKRKFSIEMKGGERHG